MWRLRFLIADTIHARVDRNYTKGAWLVELSLMEHSPPTYIDSHLLIADARTLPPLLPSSTTTTSSESMVSMPGNLFSRSTDAVSSKPKPTIELRIKTSNSQQLAPHSKSRHESASFVDALYVPLGKNTLGNSLQFECVFASCVIRAFTNDPALLYDQWIIVRFARRISFREAGGKASKA